MAKTPTGRIKKYGVCLNSSCPQYKQIQEIVHGELECPECKKKLSPCAPPKKKSNAKLPLIIGGATAVVAAAVGFVVAFSGGKTTQKSQSTGPVVTDSLKKDTVAAEKPETVTVVKTDTVVQTVKTKEQTSVNKQPKPVAPKTPRNSNYGTVNLGYGRYTGDLKNGQPHGHGTITYTKKHKIVSSKDYVANAGDTFEGDFREGKVSGNLGYWKHDGGELTPIKP